jgi:hypothetical protein
MEATSEELQKHRTRINALLLDICDASDPAPLIQLADGTLALASSCPSSLCREVTTDLGLRETALRLPIPDTLHPRFWIAMQEQWKWKSKKKLRFIECGLRLYLGQRDEPATQFLRLEWVAPELGRDGALIYQGEHAGHPHWHLDRSALVGHEDYLRALDILTAPATQAEAEEFNESLAIVTPPRPLVDFSWLQNIHLPAQAEWMHPPSWDGRTIPGPHQSEPKNIAGLEHWWAGALKYFTAELPR